jgi:hypothetical protein
MVIPAIEALHIGPIPASAFRSFILTAKDGCGGHLWHRVEASAADVLSILSEVSDKWSVERQRCEEERRARGDFSELNARSLALSVDHFVLKSRSVAQSVPPTDLCCSPAIDRPHIRPDDGEEEYLQGDYHPKE